MLSSIGAAMSGLASATTRFDRAATNVAQAPSPTTDPVADQVDEVTAAHDFAANLATVRTADDMVGTLINTIA